LPRSHEIGSLLREQNLLNEEFLIGWFDYQLGRRYTKESKKLSALLFFKFIYTKVGVELGYNFST
jgi:hypothetical protein